MTAKSNKLGVYIHFPFCSSKCNYCSFFSVDKINSHYRKYIDKIKTDLKDIQSLIKQNQQFVDTVYIGGGTPSLIENNDISCIVKPFENAKEITVEVNPCSVSREKLENFRIAGVNRISIGVQSLNKDILKFLGRKHSKESALECIKVASDIFDNISVDFIIGVDSLKRDLEEEIETVLEANNIKHISLYGLSVEKGTPFYEMGVKPSENSFVKDYELVDTVLTQNNTFSHYEVSNFALLGYESIHNMKYWNRNDYLGVGPSAHSFFRNKRFCFDKGFEDFFKFSLADKLNTSKELTLQDEKFEEIMLALRLKKGVNQAIIDDNKKGVLSQLEKEEFIKISGGYIKVTLKGWMVLNQIISKLAF